jgi:hypothetical protein
VSSKQRGKGAVVKSAVREIVGRTIAGVVVKEGDGKGPPSSQVFLLFSDGTFYEFYSSFNEVIGVGGVCKGSLNDVRKYMTPRMQIVREFVDETLLHRDETARPAAECTPAR